MEEVAGSIPIRSTNQTTCENRHPLRQEIARSHLLAPGTEGYAKGAGTCPREHPNDMPSGSLIVDPETGVHQTDLAVKKMTSFTGAGYVHHASALFAQWVA